MEERYAFARSIPLSLLARSKWYVRWAELVIIIGIFDGAQFTHISPSLLSNLGNVIKMGRAVVRPSTLDRHSETQEAMPCSRSVLDAIAPILGVSRTHVLTSVCYRLHS